MLLPVRKTAKGDLNYPVVLKYGGKMPPAFGRCPACSFPWSAT